MTPRWISITRAAVVLRLTEHEVRDLILADRLAHRLAGDHYEVDALAVRARTQPAPAVAFREPHYLSGDVTDLGEDDLGDALAEYLARHPLPQWTPWSAGDSPQDAAYRWGEQDDHTADDDRPVQGDDEDEHRGEIA